MLPCNAHFSLESQVNTQSSGPVGIGTTRLYWDYYAVNLHEYHASSTYTYEWDGVPGTPTRGLFGLGSLAVGPHTVCVTETTSYRTTCKICLDFCVNSGYDPTGPSLMKKIPLDDSKDIKLSPNPANNKTELQFSLTQKEAVLVSVFDMAGKKVMDLPAKTYEVGAQKIELNTQSLPAGIYQVQIAIGDKITTKKLSVTN